MGQLGPSAASRVTMITAWSHLVDSATMQIYQECESRKSGPGSSSSLIEVVGRRVAAGGLLLLALLAELCESLLVFTRCLELILADKAGLTFGLGLGRSFSVALRLSLLLAGEDLSW